jgi:hypothetical protein
MIAHNVYRIVYMVRNKAIIVRVTEAERDLYHPLAVASGKSLGEYIRYLLDRELTIKAANLAESPKHSTSA